MYKYSGHSTFFDIVLFHRLPLRDVVATVAHVAGDSGGREARGRALRRARTDPGDPEGRRVRPLCEPRQRGCSHRCEGRCTGWSKGRATVPRGQSGSVRPGPKSPQCGRRKAAPFYCLYAAFRHPRSRCLTPAPAPPAADTGVWAGPLRDVRPAG
jgi:hypothetical protein